MAVNAHPSYEYEDCVAMHQKHPATFEVPTDEELLGLKVGDTVKLIFKVSAFSWGVSAERMWVVLTKIDSEHDVYEGVLNNDPAVLNMLQCDDPVIPFSRRHIADIWPS